MSHSFYNSTESYIGSILLKNACNNKDLSNAQEVKQSISDASILAHGQRLLHRTETYTMLCGHTNRPGFETQEGRARRGQQQKHVREEMWLL